MQHQVEKLKQQLTEAQKTVDEMSEDEIQIISLLRQQEDSRKKFNSTTKKINRLLKRRGIKKVLDIVLSSSSADSLLPQKGNAVLLKNSPIFINHRKQLEKMRLQVAKLKQQLSETHMYLEEMEKQESEFSNLSTEQDGVQKHLYSVVESSASEPPPAKRKKTALVHNSSRNSSTTADTATVEPQESSAPLQSATTVPYDR